MRELLISVACVEALIVGRDRRREGGTLCHSLGRIWWKIGWDNVDQFDWESRYNVCQLIDTRDRTVGPCLIAIRETLLASAGHKKVVEPDQCLC